MSLHAIIQLCPQSIALMLDLRVELVVGFEDTKKGQQANRHEWPPQRDARSNGLHSVGNGPVRRGPSRSQRGRNSGEESRYEEQNTVYAGC